MHDSYLENLIHHLDDVGESPDKIRWIMKDGIWMKEGSFERISLCDLICVYYDGTAIPIELKGSQFKRSKAISQIKQGISFIYDVLRLQCPYGRFVTYSSRGYKSEMIFFTMRFNGKPEDQNV